MQSRHVIRNPAPGVRRVFYPTGPTLGSHKGTAAMFGRTIAAAQYPPVQLGLRQRARGDILVERPAPRNNFVQGKTHDDEHLCIQALSPSRRDDRPYESVVKSLQQKERTGGNGHNCLRGVRLSPLHCKGATSCFSHKNHLPKETKKRKRKGKKKRFDHSTLFFRPYLFWLRPQAAPRRQGSSRHPQRECVRVSGTLPMPAVSGFPPARE
jgi:hypothetical protein